MKSKNYQRILLTTGLPALIGALLTALAIYNFGSYGIAVFILIPLMLGFIPGYLYHKNYHKNIKPIKLGFISLLLYFLILISVAIEGVICIIMALPLEALLVFLGANLVKFYIPNNYTLKNNLPFLLIVFIPFLSFIEKDAEPSTHSVSTEIIVNVPIQNVWKHIIEFPELSKPTELIFKAGISYPIHAHIEGKGVGAIRYCTFSTGSFLEPITTWQEPNLLAFSVLEQPKPMTEISWYDLQAPHLDDYFLSKNGEFKMEAISQNQTKITGTTWYIHKIKPEKYWEFWSKNIIHTIHNRVLSHIKQNAEKEYQQIK